MAFLSYRGRVIASQMFIIPLILTILWVLIPVTSYTWFCFSVFVYYSFSLWSWLTYYDVVIPGCPIAFLIGAYCAFTGLSFASFWFIKNIFEDQNEKFSFLFLGAYSFVCSSGCYLCWIIYYFYQYRIDPSILDQGVFHRDYGTLDTLRPVEHSRWTERFVIYLTKSSRIDRDDFDDSSDEEDRNNNQATDSLSRSSQVRQKLLAEQEFQNFQDQIEKDMMKKEFEWDYPRIGFRSYFFSMIFQLSILLVWLWLQVFTDMVGTGNRFDSTGSILGCILLFEISRVICLMVCKYINSLLPPGVETHYFTQFLLRMMFWFYYRSLFVNFDGWFQTVGASIVVFISRVLLYPIMMTKTAYRFIYSTLRKALTTEESLRRFSFLAFTFDPQVTPYETHITDLVVEYYFDQTGALYSLLTSTIVIAVIKGSDYNLKYYSLYDDNLDGSDFTNLIFRYIYLLLFEFVADRVLRYICLRFLHLDVSDQGRKLTVDHPYTRYLFIVFVLYSSVDIYYSLLEPTGF